MKVDVRGLSILTREASALANRAKLTGREEKRYALLLSQISLLKTGEVTLAELEHSDTNDAMRRNGLPEIPRHESRAEAEAWQVGLRLMYEKRTANETQGNILARVGSYSGLGFFVPTEFINQVYAAAAAHDAFLDEDAVTVVKSTNGRVSQVPVYGDIENVAAVIGESVDSGSSEANISSKGQANVGVYSYRTPMWKLPMESFQDVEVMGDAVNLFKQFASDRVARGVANDLTNGNGSGKPLGIIPALQNLGVQPTIATGSAGNTGGEESGVNSIGSGDIATLYYSVNEAYRSSPKCAFFMNDSTRAYLAQIVTKQGIPLVHWQGPEAFIFGKPVRVCPSMQSMGVGNVPVLFGDGSYWMTKTVVDVSAQEPATYVQLIREVAGLPENGLVALKLWCRFGGALLFTDPDSPAPFNYIQNHT